MAIMTSVRSRPYLFSLLIFILLLTIASLPWSASEQGRSDARTFLQKTTSTTASDKNDDLLVYVYYETPEAKINLQFFIDHAVHDKMDFIFVINGDELSVDIPKRHNFEVIRRENKCFDLGAMGEVLWADYARLRSRYKRFILTNASVRGPFMPAWAQQYGLCWSDIYFNYITDTTKLVGLSSNCAPMFTPHIQSMLLAVDRVGLDLIKPALRCAVNFWDAVGNGETKLTSLVRNAGFGAMPMTAETRGKVYDSTEDYWRHCDHGDLFFPNKYYGMDVHPYDSIFAKVHRTVIDATTPPTSYSPAGLVVLEKLTEWANTGNYSSYDFCKR